MPARHREKYEGFLIGNSAVLGWRMGMNQEAGLWEEEATLTDISQPRGGGRG